MLTIDTIGTKTILQFPNKKYFQTSGNVISDCLRISDNIDSTPDTATIFVLKAAGAGEVLNIQVTMRDLLAPFSLPHFQQETGFLSVVAGCWRSVIIPNWSWDKWIVSDAAGSSPSLSSRICQSLSNITDNRHHHSIIRRGKNFRKFWELCE